MAMAFTVWFVAVVTLGVLFATSIINGSPRRTVVLRGVAFLVLLVVSIGILAGVMD